MSLGLLHPAKGNSLYGYNLLRSIRLSMSLCPCIIDRSIRRIFKPYDRSSQNTVQQSQQPQFPPAPSHLPLYNSTVSRSVSERLLQTCTISAATIVLMLNCDIILKCYPIKVRQGRMKQGSSFCAIIATWRSVAASRAATGCREINATDAWK